MEQTERDFTHLVVIGASAGGIESLSVLVSTLPRSFPAPIVVAQHLSPSRTSALGEILDRRCPLPVRTIVDRVKLEPGVVYVVPPNRNVRIIDHEVMLVGDGRGVQPSIDLLFRTAAEAYKENLIAVVLSGTGSDGAVGAREVKYAGGTVIIQNPETAAYPGMPLSLSPSVVDVVANRERIGELLNELVTGQFVVPPLTEHTQLRSFLEELRDQSGVDFTSYKQATIERRLQRRMAVTGQPNLADYIRHVHANPDEGRRLINSFLVKVTEFFRDPELYTYLQEQVLPELIQEAKDRDSDLRIWSAGCATGEEAYSLAMITADVLGENSSGVNVRIFATDLDGDAVAFARHGIYPARSLANLPPGLLHRHFTEHGDDFEVRKSLRSMVVFGEHDLAQRAPFPRIDLILCRNVLIYFTPVLQRRALQLFAFSLRTGGYLVLGKSETTNPLAEYFVVDQPRLKIFRRAGDRALIPTSRIRDSLPATTASAGDLRHARTFVSRPTRQAHELSRSRAGWHEESVLLGLPVGVILVDRNYDIQYINSEARSLFSIHSTALEQDLIHQIEAFDPLTVRKAIDSARTRNEPVSVLITSSSDDGAPERTLELTCAAVALDEQSDRDLVSVTALDVTEREQYKRRLAAADEVVNRVTRTKEEVLASNQELTRTIARLRLENEELVVASEEIQAATEEVETLNEELQASNEELETLNEEMQATVEELNTTNDDLQARTMELQTLAIEGESARRRLRAILDGVDSAVAVVDSHGSISLKNEEYIQLFDRPEAEVVLVDEQGTRLRGDELPVSRAAQGKAFTMTFGTRTPDGIRWLVAVGKPLGSPSEEPLVVVSFREVERSLTRNDLNASS